MPSNQVVLAVAASADSDDDYDRRRYRKKNAAGTAMAPTDRNRASHVIDAAAAARRATDGRGDRHIDRHTDGRDPRTRSKGRKTPTNRRGLSSSAVAANREAGGDGGGCSRGGGEAVGLGESQRHAEHGAEGAGGADSGWTACVSPGGLGGGEDSDSTRPAGSEEADGEGGRRGDDDDDEDEGDDDEGDDVAGEGDDEVDDEDEDGGGGGSDGEENGTRDGGEEQEARGTRRGKRARAGWRRGKDRSSCLCNPATDNPRERWPGGTPPEHPNPRKTAKPECDAYREPVGACTEPR